jgi:predicted GIY-YIG superfamily endonuclease
VNPTSIYRYYDRDGKLIYVGITGAGMIRQTQHNRMADWWRFVSTQEVEHVDTRQDALRRERELIRLHRPPFNKEHNPDWQKLRTAYLAHVEAQSKPCGESVGCDYDDESQCTAFTTINDTWCGRAGCHTCHLVWHSLNRGFEEGSDHGEGQLADSLAGLCASDNEDIARAARAARSALATLAEAAEGSTYSILTWIVTRSIPTDEAIAEAVALRESLVGVDWTEVPF